jgi:hypothetical protein
MRRGKSKSKGKGKGKGKVFQYVDVLKYNSGFVLQQSRGWETYSSFLWVIMGREVF